MDNRKLFAANRLKQAAAVYFIGLATINISLTCYNAGFKWADLIVLATICLPFVVNKKITYLLFGFISALISSYLLLACLSFSLSPQVTTTGTELFMGFVMILATLCFSIGLMYVGLQSREKNRFSLI